MYNFYPRPPRGGRPKFDEHDGVFERISIHALREEGDRLRNTQFHKLKSFLSTPSARRATLAMLDKIYHAVISIHALREEGDQCAMCYITTFNISIHALREEGDASPRTRSTSRRNFYPRPPRGGRQSKRRTCFSVPSHFYPRPPRGGRRAQYDLRQQSQPISIHALREEGDSKNRDKISIFKQIIQHSARI